MGGFPIQLFRVRSRRATVQPLAAPGGSFRRPRAFCLPLLAPMMLLGVGLILSAGASPARGEEGLTLAVAASLQPVVQALNELHAAAGHPPATLVVAATGHLARQIRNGAPYHLFFAADEDWLRQLAAEGAIVEASAAAFATARLALVFPGLGSSAGQPPIGAEGLSLLTGDGVRFVAIANPEFAPYGWAARAALRNAGLWEALSNKLVFGANIRQTLQYVESGNADAGLVAESLVLGWERGWRPIDPGLHPPLRQTVGLVKGAPPAAERFVALLYSEPGRAALRRFGYVPLPGADRP